MTEQQILLVKSSWLTFRHIKPATIADLFYSKLFMEHPELRKMFPKHMEAQYQKLIDMLNAIVARLDEAEILSDDITALAYRHKSYGVQPAHYRYVGEALLWTLERGLGNDWTKDTAEAWKACYHFLSASMLKA